MAARESLSLPGIDMTPENRRRIMAFVGGCNGIYDVDVIPRRPTRSGQQNRFLHGILFSMLATEMKNQGNADADLEMAKSYLKCKYLWMPLIDPATGEQIGHYVRDTHKLSINECSEFIEKCIEHLETDWHLVVPDPGNIIERIVT